MALLYVADEETGSDFGIGWLLKEHEDLFSKDDLILVPDGGDPSGALVEVAEKGLLWIRFTVHGKQAHASMPAHGANAARAAAAATLALDRALRERYPESDDLFAPPESTFEPTKRAANVPNVNTIPGRDEFHFDCRVLPRYETQEAFDFALEEVRRTVEPLGCTAEAEIVHHEPAAPPTSPDAPVVRALIEALNEVRGIEGRPMGVGGGTVAALFRRAGYPAAVWSTFMEVAHSPNEFAVIDNVVADAQVYAHLFTRAADRAS